jgi:1,2-phenylacetyl-CoA epoxidase catalytic subunit
MLSSTAWAHAANHTTTVMVKIINGTVEARNRNMVAITTDWSDARDMIRLV